MSHADAPADVARAEDDAGVGPKPGVPDSGGVKKSEMEKAILETVLSELRKQSSELDKDRSMPVTRVEELQHDGSTPYSLQPEWADVTPLDANEGLPEVVAVQYEACDQETLGYFYAVLAKGELSARVLALTEEVISINSANYTAWDLRWRCLQALPPKFLAQEEGFLESMLETNPKNYQLWNYRRRYALLRGPAHVAEELAYVDKCLEGDAKNYHAWSHRVAVAGRFGAWGGELALTARMLGADVRNNSAWNHRFSALSALAKQRDSEELFQEELAYTSGMIRKAPHNESAWVYLRGLCTCLGVPHRMALEPALRRLCCEVLEKRPSCSHAIEFSADVCAAEAHREHEEQHQPSTAAAKAGQAQHCYQQLEIADPIRCLYWRLRRRELQAYANG